MGTQTLPGGPVSLQTRVVNILSKPAMEWPVIAAEPRDIAGLYKNYFMVLAAIPAVCAAIGQSVVGVSLPLVGFYRVPFLSAIVSGVFTYVLGLVGLYVAAFIVAKLAPTFQSEPDVGQALKLVGYSSTPLWVAGVLYLIPVLGILAILAGLYGVYLAYLGMTPTMKTPPDKVIVYTVVAAVVMIVVSFVIGLITAPIVAAIGFSTLPANFRL